MAKDDTIFTHSSGATSSGEKPPYHLIPISLLRRTAKQMGHGAAKHSPYNYEKGLGDKQYILERLSHAVEHLHIAMDNISRGILSMEDNLAGVVCNVAFAMEYQKRVTESSFEKSLPQEVKDERNRKMATQSPLEVLANTTLSTEEVRRMSPTHYYDSTLKTWVPKSGTLIKSKPSDYEEG